MPYTITPAIFPTDKQAITALFSAYTASLGLDLTYQDYATELRCLPGKYSSEKGGIVLVAREDNNKENLVGCVALRALPGITVSENDAVREEKDDDDDDEKKGYCEMKRLYISPSARGTGLGGRLVEAVIQHARHTNLYRGIKLDTLSSQYMASARALYRKYGFEEVDAYYETPVEGTIFMGLEF